MGPKAVAVGHEADRSHVLSQRDLPSPGALPTEQVEKGEAFVVDTPRHPLKPCVQGARPPVPIALDES